MALTPGRARGSGTQPFKLIYIPLYGMFVERGDTMSCVYERIKKRRLALGLTVEQLAKQMGYKSKSSVSKVENGRLDITQSMVDKYAVALGVTTAYLLGVE